MRRERRAALDRQLAGIGRYCVSPLCRHRLLVEHFGQSYAPPAPDGCGACDVCLGEIATLDGDEALLTAQKILSCVWRLDSRYGASYVAQVLRVAEGEDAGERDVEAERECGAGDLGRHLLMQ